MSAIAENLRRQRLPLLTIALVLVLGASAWAVVSQATSDDLTAPGDSSAAPASDQAKWKVDYTSARRYGKLSKAQQARYAAQREKATVLVQDLYDGIFLEPARLPGIVKGSFTTDASRSFEAKGLGFPNGAQEVKTTKRTVNLALDATTASTAIGRVTVAAKANLDNKVVRVEHESTLWMERNENGWRVIAFDVRQNPVK